MLPLDHNAENFWPFGKGSFSIWPNFELIWANFIWYWANFHRYKWPNIKQIILSSGHSDRRWRNNGSFKQVTKYFARISTKEIWVESFLRKIWQNFSNLSVENWSCHSTMSFVPLVLFNKFKFFPSKVEKMGTSTAPFSFYFCLFQTAMTILTTNKCENVHPVCGAGIRTHDRRNTSLLT